MIDMDKLNRYICGILDCDTDAAAAHVGAALGSFSMGEDYAIVTESGVHKLFRDDFRMKAVAS
mgnify:CR=1 FL=1